MAEEFFKEGNPVGRSQLLPRTYSKAVFLHRSLFAKYHDFLLKSYLQNPYQGLGSPIPRPQTVLDRAVVSQAV